MGPFLPYYILHARDTAEAGWHISPWELANRHITSSSPMLSYILTLVHVHVQLPWGILGYLFRTWTTVAYESLWSPTALEDRRRREESVYASADLLGCGNRSVMGNPSTNEDYLRGGGGENVFGEGRRSLALQPLRWVTSIARHSRQRRNFYLSNLLSWRNGSENLHEIAEFGCVNLHF